MTNGLTPADKRRLQQYEAMIENGLNSWLEVSRALLAIREEQLYLSQFDTFEGYCQGRWQMGRRYANYLITSLEAAEDVANVETVVGTIVPTSEAISREIAKVESETDRADLWAKAVETAPKNQPTASHVAKVRREMFPEVRQRTIGAGDVRRLVQRIEETLETLAELRRAFRRTDPAWEEVLDYLVSGQLLLKEIAKRGE